MFAALKNNTIVRIVGEHSVNNTYTVMQDVTEKYDEDKAIIISQDDVLEIDTNLRVLWRRVSLNGSKT